MDQHGRQFRRIEAVVTELNQPNRTISARVQVGRKVAQDFVRILSATRASLTEQYQALLGTEGVTITFADDGIEALARIAAEVNEAVENIGARRLQTIMERVLDDPAHAQRVAAAGIETIRAHERLSKRALFVRAVELLEALDLLEAVDELGAGGGPGSSGSCGLRRSRGACRRTSTSS